ncbi:MAG TPA: serine/threonine-protein kinase [Luteimonas sp.]|nr:serine/threonine-protein kinase [Luteimonas sp.]
MEPDKLAQWQAADALFDQWLDLAEAERDAWLALQPAPEAVRRRLDQLIAAHRQPRAALEAAGNELAGRRLGDWILDEELGRGGMAVVHRAWRECGVARQQAAIKVLTLGALGAAGRERFHREAAILARLNHPNVTALIDSGVADDGTCWLAMPLVEGERIDRWCDAHALDARAIVRLYLQVCGAVAYAHRSLVIHRDLKPSNVLVDADGQVRLLDFGIGQFADTAGERTQTMWRAMTPGYAAPEQLRGDPPGTAVDVYGLGALLHRLLTGRTPQAATAGADTTRPSLLVRDAADAYHRHYVPLKNDLDRVLLKALAEEPEHRYATAEAMADDLRRWLDGRPVLAQKPKAGYRLRKFVMRNKTGVAAGVLLAASLAGGIAATLWQAGEARKHAAQAEQQAAIARQEAENARQRAHRAEAVRDFLGNMFITVRADDGGGARVDDVMRAAADGAERLADEPLTAADVLLLTGTVRYNLDDHDGSLADLEDALERLAPHRAVAAGEMSRAHWELTRHAKHRGDHAAMLAHAREAVELNKLWDATPDEAFRARISLGEALLYTDRKAAEQTFRALVDEIEASELKDSVRHINALNGLSIALSGPEHDQRLRLPIQEERLRIARKLYAADGGGLAFTLSDVTHTFRKLGMLDRAEQLARESVGIADRSLQNPLMLRGMSRCNLGEVLLQGGRHAEALDVFEASVAALRDLGGNNLATERCFTGLAYAAAASARQQQALDALSRSRDILAANSRQQHPDALRVCGLRASVQLRQGDSAAAGRTLAGCRPSDEDSAPLPYLQARAEWLASTGESVPAAALLDKLRGRHPPDDIQREWMRPWMLSALHAQRAGEPTSVAALASTLGAYADAAPLSHCLAEPNQTRCLALP